MKTAKTSATIMIAVGVLAGGATAASACDWHDKQVLANKAPPPAEEQVVTSSTPIDPVLLAKIRSTDSDAEIPVEK